MQVVETLDERNNCVRHEMWLPEPQPAAAEEEEVELDPDSWESQPAEQKLADVLQYLRQSHLYCLFCGCQVCNTSTRFATCCSYGSNVKHHGGSSRLLSKP